MITIKSASAKYGINFPSDVTEITPEMLTSITSNVKLPKYYCIVALCYKTKVFDFVASLNKKSSPMVATIPLIAKISEEDAKDRNVQVGDRIITDRSAIERGTHINLKTMVSLGNAGNYFTKDRELIGQIIKGEYNYGENQPTKPEIIIIEFKILPVGEIYAAIDSSVQAIDPFIANTIN